MEHWEIELRDKLDKELIHGSYEIGTEPMVMYTGKGGKIDFIIAIEKALRSYGRLD